MDISKRALMVMLSVLFLWGTLSLGLPPVAQAAETDREDLREQRLAEREELREQIHQRRRSFFLDRLAALPPCGPGTEGQRFVLKDNGMEVCDNTTGVLWEREPTGTFSWGDAIQHCEDMDGNDKDWRLPTVRELLSLVNFSEKNQAAALNEPKGPFKNVKSDCYWSGTSFASDTAGAWGVLFNFGNVNNVEKNNTKPVWCVR